MLFHAEKEVKRGQKRWRRHDFATPQAMLISGGMDAARGISAESREARRSRRPFVSMPKVIFGAAKRPRNAAFLMVFCCVSLVFLGVRSPRRVGRSCGRIASCRRCPTRLNRDRPADRAASPLERDPTASERRGEAVSTARRGSRSSSLTFYAF